MCCMSNLNSVNVCCVIILQQKNQFTEMTKCRNIHVYDPCMETFDHNRNNAHNKKSFQHDDDSILFCFFCFQ